MTLGFALFAFGLALVYSALKDKSVAEVLSGALGEDVPFGNQATATELGSPGISGGKNISASPALLAYLQTAAKVMFGLRISEPIGRDSGGHVADSYHKENRAFDASGTPAQMQRYFNWVKTNFGGSVTELFYDPAGAIKNGKPIAPVGDHIDHVHTAI